MNKQNSARARIKRIKSQLKKEVQLFQSHPEYLDVKDMSPEVAFIEGLERAVRIVYQASDEINVYVDTDKPFKYRSTSSSRYT